MRLIVLAFLSGVLLCHYFPDLPINLGIILGFTVINIKYPHFRYLLAVSIGYIWTLWHINFIIAQTFPTELESQDIIIVGHIVDLPQQIDGRWQFYFTLEQLQFKNKQYDFTGKIRLTWYKNRHELYPGQRWQLTVRLKRPHALSNFGVHNYSPQVKRISAIGYIRDLPAAKLLQEPSAWHIDNWRYHLALAIYQALPDNEITHLLVALAVGHQRAISSQQYQILQHTGTIHLMAISGLHIGLVAMGSLFVFQLLCRVGIYPSRLFLKIAAPHSSAIFSLLFAFIYTLLSGFSVPTQRAFIMITAFVCTVLLKRHVAISQALSLALLFVLIWDPLSIQTQGFWLSFGAVAILGYVFVGRRTLSIDNKDKSIFKYLSFITQKKQFSQDTFFQLEPHYFDKIPEHAPVIKKYFLSPNRPQLKSNNLLKFINLFQIFIYLKTISKLKKWVKMFSKTQIAISLALLPVLLMLFGYIPLTTIFANAIAIPVVSFITLPFTLFATFVILVFPSTGSFILTIAAYIMEKLWIYLVWLDQIGAWEWEKPSLFTVIIATIGVLILLLPRGFPNKWLGIIWLCPLFFTTNHTQSIQYGEVQFTLLDVGQGLAAAIRTQRHVWLYDTGIKFNENFDSGKSVILPFLAAQQIDKIDLMIVSHVDDDHSGGLNSIVAAMPVNKILTSDPHELNHILPNYPFQPCHLGQHWEIDGVTFDILNPSQHYLPKGNNRSCVLKITTGDYAILLTGDIEQIAEKWLVKSIGNQLTAEVLVMPHHGSLTSSTETFIDTVKPEIALFSVGYKNKFNFPKPEVLKRYKNRQIFTLLTSQTGAIRFNMTQDGIFQLHFAKKSEN